MQIKFLAPIQRWLPAVIGGLCVMSLLGCNSEAKVVLESSAIAKSELRIVGAADVLPLAHGVQQVVTQTTQLLPQIQFSTTSVDDLKAGRADVVLLGREPTEAELQIVDDHVIAYDAICFLVSTRVYSGGVRTLVDWTPQHLMSKLEGLRNLSESETEKIVKQALRRFNYDWVWDGPYFEFAREKPTSPGWLADPLDASQPLGTWVRQKTSLPLQMFAPEKFDSTSQVLEKFGFTANDFNDARKRKLLTNNGILNFIDLEEEAISYYFVRKRTQPREVGPDSFTFILLPASRQVTLRAIKHRYQVRAVAINGINPMTDIQAIYDGSYMFSRKIHVLTRKSPNESTQAYVRFLQSSEGQAAIEKASFLPLPKTSGKP